MTEEQQRIAIAEFCGWRLSSPNKSWPNPFWVSPKDQVLRVLSELPDFLHDLNAVHEAEEKLNIPQSVQYERWLDELVNEDFRTGEGCIIRPAWHATAAQRSEALLQTIGKWLEDKR